MTSQRPYLIKAILDWILDNNATPYVAIDTGVSGVVVPTQYIKDKKIVLNISSDAVRNFSIEQGWMTFDSRFSGSGHHIATPLGAIVAIYSKESGQGMMFEADTSDPTSAPTDSSHGLNSGKSSHLQIVK